MGKPTKHRGKWRIRWTDHAGRRQSEVHDAYQDAELALRRHQLEALEIKRGERSAMVRGKTVEELCDYWLASRATRKRSSRDDRSIIERHLRPAFGPRPVTALGVADLDRFQAERAHLSPKTVHNHLTLLISMLRLAVDLGWLREVPRIRKPQISTLDEDYQYLRTAGEIVRFLAATHAEDEPVHVLYATTLYTGLRAGEVAGLDWADVDFDQRLIAVRRSYQGPTKGGRSRVVPPVSALFARSSQSRKTNEPSL